MFTTRSSRFAEYGRRFTLGLETRTTWCSVSFGVSASDTSATILPLSQSKKTQTCTCVCVFFFLFSVSVNGIHNDIEPQQDEGTVRYIHITEVPGQYTMGIFVFPPHGRIPLHDHPEMCVLSRVLYGDLDRLSLDLVNEEKVAAESASSSSLLHQQTATTAPSKSLLKSAWNACRFGAATLPPKGSKRAFRNRVDHLVAPACTALYPYEGNLHEFVAGPHGAAVLDVLLPPYDGQEGRDCTFYHIREDESMTPINGRNPCWIVPTGQPEDFHCISGWYGGLGLSQESQEEDDSENMMM